MKTTQLPIKGRPLVFSETQAEELKWFSSHFHSDSALPDGLHTKKLPARHTHTRTRRLKIQQKSPWKAQMYVVTVHQHTCTHTHTRRPGCILKVCICAALVLQPGPKQLLLVTVQLHPYKLFCYDLNSITLILFDMITIPVEKSSDSCCFSH